MSKRQVLRFTEVKFPSGMALRAATEVAVSYFFVANKGLSSGQRVTLSVKAGARRRMFSGTLRGGLEELACGCCTELVPYTVSK
jgi:hypothetical protein